MPKIELSLPNGGPTVQADVTKVGLFAVHETPGEEGYAITHVPTGLRVMRLERKGVAVKCRKALEASDPAGWETMADFLQSGQ